MQLPKYKKKKRIKLKICQEPGCGREFWGHPIAKYCELHRDIKLRQKQKKNVESIESKNIIFRRLRRDVYHQGLPQADRVSPLLPGTQERLQAREFHPHHAEKERLGARPGLFCDFFIAIP